MFTVMDHTTLLIDLHNLQALMETNACNGRTNKLKNLKLHAFEDRQPKYRIYMICNEGKHETKTLKIENCYGPLNTE